MFDGAVKANGLYRLTAITMMFIVCEVEAEDELGCHCLVSPVGAFALRKWALEADPNGSADAALAARFIHRPRGFGG